MTQGWLYHISILSYPVLSPAPHSCPLCSGYTIRSLLGCSCCCSVAKSCPRRLHHARLPCPWMFLVPPISLSRSTSPYRTGILSSVKCKQDSVFERMKRSEVKVAQSCPTLCDPVNYTVHGILQARILEWVAFPFSNWDKKDMVSAFKTLKLMHALDYK